MVNDEGSVDNGNRVKEEEQCTLHCYFSSVPMRFAALYRYYPYTPFTRTNNLINDPPRRP
jgi:hypothetical protein